MDESPFLARKNVFHREESFWERHILGSIDRAQAIFVKAIPSDDVKQLPPSYRYPVGTLVFAVLLAIFAAVFIPGYLTAVRTKFLAPLDSGNDKYCDDVTISNTGTFLASRSGRWQGSEGFTIANGSYTLTVTNFQVTEAEFSRDMASIYFKLLDIGKYAKTQNLGTNLLFWMSWAEVEDGYESQRFTMSGTPLAVLNRAITAGTVSNVHGDCNAVCSSSFNPGSGQMQVTYDVQQFLANPNCSNAANPALFGYKSYIPSAVFNFGFDVRSLITCVALNAQIASIKALQVVGSNSFTYRGHPYPIASYVDPRYPGMKPVLCILPNGPDGAPLCSIIVGSVYAVPLFNHGGKSFKLPVPCNCSDLAVSGEDIHSNPYNMCNVFNFLTGFIFYQTDPSQGMNPEPALDLLFRYNNNNTAQTLNDLAFTAMFTAGMYGTSSPNRTTFNSAEQRQAMYAFCYNAQYGNCSIVTFNSVDESSDSTDWVVSQGYYQVTRGACSDSFSSTREAWDLLVEEPFAPLTQQYQTCQNDPTNAFFTQAGVSVGNVSLLSPLGVLLVLSVLALYQFCSGASIPRAYSRREKDAALDALALAMLLVRDRRLGQGGAAQPLTPQHQSTEKPHPEQEQRHAHGAGGGNSAVAAEPAGNEGVARRAAVLAELVEALGEVAAAAQRDPSLQMQRGSEVAYIDWRQVQAALLGSKSTASRNDENNIGTGSSSSGNGSGSSSSGGVRGGAARRASRNGSEAAAAGAGVGADSDDDDVELATLSALH